MDLISEKPLQSISDASQKALHLFRSCALRTKYAKIDLESMEWQFRAWAKRLGVFSQSASLDMQLRAEKYDKSRQRVMSYLKVLNENLSLGMQFIVT